MDLVLWPVLWNAWKGSIWCTLNRNLITVVHLNSMLKPVRFLIFSFRQKITCIVATLPDDEDFKDAVAKLKEFTGLDVRIMTQGDGDDNLPWFPQVRFKFLWALIGQKLNDLIGRMKLKTHKSISLNLIDSQIKFCHTDRNSIRTILDSLMKFTALEEKNLLILPSPIGRSLPVTWRMLTWFLDIIRESRECHILQLRLPPGGKSMTNWLSCTKRVLVANSTTSFPFLKNTVATHVTIFPNSRTFPTFWQKQPVSDFGQSLVCCLHVTSSLDWLLGYFTQRSTFDIHQSLFTLLNRKFVYSTRTKVSGKARVNTVTGPWFLYSETVAMNC